MKGKKLTNIQPTWLSMLPALLVLNTQYDKAVSRKKVREEDVKNRNFLREQLKNMAIAADNWNTHCETLKK